MRKKYIFDDLKTLYKCQVLYTPFFVCEMSADYSQCREDTRKSQNFKSKANITHIDICT